MGDNKEWKTVWDKDEDAAWQDAACPVCGGNDFVWGTVRGHYPLRFKSDEERESGLLSKYTVIGGHDIRARLCRRCGNIQIFLAAKAPSAKT